MKMKSSRGSCLLEVVGWIAIAFGVLSVLPIWKKPAARRTYLVVKEGGSREDLLEWDEKSFMRVMNEESKVTRTHFHGQYNLNDLKKGDRFLDEWGFYTNLWSCLSGGIEINTGIKPVDDLLKERHYTKLRKL